MQDVPATATVSEANPFPYTTRPAGTPTPLGWQLQLPQQAGLRSQVLGTYTYNFNLNIQRALGATLIGQIGYVGSISHRLASWNEGDPITSAGHAACLADTTGYDLPRHLAVDPPLLPSIHGPAGHRRRAALQRPSQWVRLVPLHRRSDHRRLLQLQLLPGQPDQGSSHGLPFTAAYTYSHALDDGSVYDSGTGSAGRVRNYVPGFEYLNYGSSDFDARHRLSTSYVYVVPVAGFLKSNLIAREALGGWGISGVTALQTGFPIGINQSVINSGWCDGYSYFGCFDTPNTSNFHLKQGNIRSASHQFFDTTPFSAEPDGTFGNTSRNFLHGPGFNYTNLSLTKNIPFSADGTRYVQLRLEAFNAFNHANFANPGDNFNSSTFGTVTQVDHSADPNSDPSPGRVIQIAGKFYF